MSLATSLSLWTLSEEALRQREDYTVVGLAAKPVGEPDAGNLHHSK
jgi:hypothetical protein